VAAWDGRARPEGSGNRLVRAFRERVVAAALLPLTAPARRALGDTVVVATEPAAWRLAAEQPPHLLPQGFATWTDLLLAAADAAAATCPGPLDACSWGEANRLAMRHPFAGVLPGLRGALSMPEAPQPGDARVPRVSGPSFGASQRLVVAPGREERGILHMPGGQAGHPMAPYWGAGHDDWAEGRPSPLLPGRPRWTLRLVPA
ncbi:MAG: penicillin acylase family protein, partial [Rubricoccaceae bacterium]